MRELPIRPLKSRAEYAAAQLVLDRLVGREDLSVGEVDYIAGLARFVEDYERQHRIGELRRLSPEELLRHLMEANNMNTSELGDVLGSRGLASEVLNGKRGLSKTLIAKLANGFTSTRGCSWPGATVKARRGVEEACRRSLSSYRTPCRWV